MLLNVYYTVVCVTLPALLANFNFAEKKGEKTKEKELRKRALPEDSKIVPRNMEVGKGREKAITARRKVFQTPKKKK